MITITPVYNKFKMKFSNPGSGWRGFTVTANDLKEVHSAIDHYHNLGHNIMTCPLCRWHDQQQKRSARMAHKTGGQ